MNCLVSNINGYDGFKTVKMSLQIIRGSPLTVNAFIPKAIQDYDIPIKYIFKKPHTTTFNCFNKKQQKQQQGIHDSKFLSKMVV